MQFAPYGNYLVQSNNTMIGYGDVALGYSCVVGGDNCSTANTTLENNIFLGYANTNYNPGVEPTMFCAVQGDDCDATSPNYPANEGWATRSNNSYYTVLAPGHHCPGAPPLSRFGPTLRARCPNRVRARRDTGAPAREQSGASTRRPAPSRGRRGLLLP